MFAQKYEYFENLYWRIMIINDLDSVFLRKRNNQVEKNECNHNDNF